MESESSQEKPQAQTQEDIERIIDKDGRYRPEAYGFLHEALAHAVKATHDPEAPPSDRHVSGKQLCDSLHDLARDRWGPMAPAVLRRWGVHGSIDFGHMVYLLIHHNVMRKTQEDSVEDFRDVFDLDSDFALPEDLKLKE